MTQTTYLDNNTINDRALLKESGYYTNDIVQEGYLTSEDFWKEADKRIIKVCKRYGVL